MRAMHFCPATTRFVVCLSMVFTAAASGCASSTSAVKVRTEVAAKTFPTTRRSTFVVPQAPYDVVRAANALMREEGSFRSVDFSGGQYLGTLTCQTLNNDDFILFAERIDADKTEVTITSTIGDYARSSLIEAIIRRLEADTVAIIAEAKSDKFPAAAVAEPPVEVLEDLSTDVLYLTPAEAIQIVEQIAMSFDFKTAQRQFDKLDGSLEMKTSARRVTAESTRVDEHSSKVSFRVERPTQIGMFEADSVTGEVSTAITQGLLKADFNARAATQPAAGKGSR